MVTGRAQAFIDALAILESAGDVAPIAGLFAQGAEVSNSVVTHRGGEEGGATAFWTGYRATFDTVRSEFRSVVEGDEVIFLEWVSEGSIGGRPIRYGGVSVLELGSAGFTAFRAYFDPAPIAREMNARG
jgi:hypothetical protein